MQYKDADNNTIDVNIVDEHLVIYAPVAVYLDVTKVLNLAPVWRQMLEALQDKIRTRKSKELDTLIAQRDALSVEIKEIQALINN